MIRPAFQKQETSVELLIDFTSWLLKQRDTLPSRDVRAGANATAIMNSASAVDGVIEWVMREELDAAHARAHREADRSSKASRANAKAEANEKYEAYRQDRLRSAYGIGDSTKKAFEELTGVQLTTLLMPHWEGLRALFELRKLIAHGRMARGDVYPSPSHAAPESVPTAASLQATFFRWRETDPDWETELVRPLRVAEAYLRKPGVLERGFLAGRDETLSDTYFTDGVADHFWNLTQASIDALSKRFDCIRGHELPRRFA